MAEYAQILLTGVIAFVIALAMGPGIIHYLYRLKYGQPIRNAGPATHLKKAGTPTMGGLIIIIALAVASLLMTREYDLLPYALFTTIGFGLVGLVDDYIKVTKKSSGLKARHKLIGQILIALFLSLFALQEPRLGAVIQIPFTQTLWYMPNWLFLLVAMTTLVGAPNGVNFSDGLDGLCAGSMAIAAATYAVVCFWLGNIELAVFATAVTGACLGFAWFNSHPAQVIMGDVGSEALGGALGSLAVLTRSELLMLIIGGLFVVELLSVVIQVTYFRLTGGKRVFRMAPIHHHFELAGWSETKVVSRFWLVALLFAVLGLLALE